MKNFYLRFAFAFGMFSLGVAAAAQDIHFSQFYDAPLYRNPALAGIVNGDVRVQALYRTQWNSFANAYKTGSVNAEYKNSVGKADDYLTLGIQLFYDRAGTTDFTSTLLMPALNFHKSISTERNMYLSLGFMGGLVQRRLDRSKMTTNSQYDGMGDGESFSRTKYSYLDGSAGISFNTGLGNNPESNLVLGLAYHHFNRPRNSFYNNPGIQLQPKWVYSADVQFGVAETSDITIRANYSRQGTVTETIAGLMYGIKMGADPQHPDYAVHAGAFLRLNDAFIPVIKLDYNPYSVAFSYDVNISKLKSTSYGRGGFELTLTYIGFLDRYNSTLNALRCPRFF
jgi:type IX secretion system PorP/SprF family membrane protein